LDSLQKNTVYLNFLYPDLGPQDYYWIGYRDSILKICSIWKYMIHSGQFFIFKNQNVAAHYLTAMAIAKFGLTTRPPSFEYKKFIHAPGYEHLFHKS
jgi:hypothetical protein